jgi:hypothetical protein
MHIYRISGRRLYTRDRCGLFRIGAIPVGVFFRVIAAIPVAVWCTAVRARTGPAVLWARHASLVAVTLAVWADCDLDLDANSATALEAGPTGAAGHQTTAAGVIAAGLVLARHTILLALTICTGLAPRTCAAVLARITAGVEAAALVFTRPAAAHRVPRDLRITGSIVDVDQAITDHRHKAIAAFPVAVAMSMVFHCRVRLLSAMTDNPIATAWRRRSWTRQP